MAEQPQNFKVIVVGGPNVGKTCLTYRYCNNQFVRNVVNTVGVDHRSKRVKVNNKWVQLKIWDTAGEERFLEAESITRHLYRNAQAVVFVYDITDQRTLLQLRKWIDVCSEHELTPDTVPCIIVGNKCDNKAERQVSMNSAIMFADAHKMPIFETSAMDDKESENVNSIFDTLAHKLVNDKTAKIADQGGVTLTDEVNEEKSSCC